MCAAGTLVDPKPVYYYVAKTRLNYSNSKPLVLKNVDGGLKGFTYFVRQSHGVVKLEIKTYHKNLSNLSERLARRQSR